HDAVLLDNANEEDDPDNANDGEVHAAELQREERADAGRRQRRQNRQRVDVALVEDAEDEIDHDNRGEDQRRRARERGLERLRVALERGDHLRRHAELSGGLRDRVDRLAERYAGTKIERQGEEGNCDWCVTDSGPALLASISTRVERGTTPPVSGDFTYRRSSESMLFCSSGRISRMTK